MTIGPPPAPHRRFVACTLAAALAATLAACGQDNRYVAPPPPKVTVALPVQQKVTRYLEATGYVAARNPHKNRNYDPASESGSGVHTPKHNRRPKAPAVPFPRIPLLRSSY